MKMARLPGVLGLATALAVFLCAPGCEEGPKEDEATKYFENEPLTYTNEDISTYTLKIWGGNTILATDGQTTVFKAAGGTPPYHWDVLDISLGTILESDDDSAVYQRNAPGDNTIILEDDEGHVTYFAVSQPL
ncbi:MAG: hypothetical protein WCL44_07950 [bacterium]